MYNFYTFYYQYGHLHRMLYHKQINCTGIQKSESIFAQIKWICVSHTDNLMIPNVSNVSTIS